MKRSTGRFRSGVSISAGLALVLVAGAGPAWGQAPSDRAGTMQRATALMQAHEFDQAAVVLQSLLAADPSNRGAKELLAFAYESMGNLDAERRVRAELAERYPNDQRAQTDYGRVLERSRDEGGALRAYRRARELAAGAATPDLDAAIERLRDRTAREIGAPLELMSDPDATASRLQPGAAIPIASRRHVALLGTRYAAEAKTNADATTSAALALLLAVRQGSGATWSVGPRLHVVSQHADAWRDM